MPAYTVAPAGTVAEMVGPRRRSRVVFALYWQLRAAELIHREGRRHEEA
jgi:hypothetical protein